MISYRVRTAPSVVSCPRKPLGKVQARRLPRPSSLRHARPGPFVTATAHAAGTLTYNSHHSRDADSGVLEELLAGPKEAYHAPAVLPPTPEAATLNAVLPYLARLALGEAQLYWRVGGALIALFASKASGLLAPVYFKSAVDAISTSGNAALPACIAALALSGLCRAASALSKELQHPLFTPVSQAAGRRISFYALAHVLSLDLHFHLGRNTGALSRMLERGARSIAMIFRAVVFTLAPTAVELVAVCVLLARSFESKVYMAVLATFVGYFVWTVAMTWAATRIRREVKDLDNAISGRAVDALLNVEAVKLGAAEALETQAYDKSLTAYQRASVRLEVASAALNAGQALLLAGGMTAAMIAAATMPGVTAGDLVMVQGLLLQLWAPLQFLGWFYRELRQSLVDMEDLFKLLRTQTAVPDGTKDLPTPPPAVSHGGTHHLGSTTHSNGNGDGKLAGVASPAPPQQGLRVVLQDVKFSYPGIDREVLKGVTITAEPGQSIAVVGPSGSGKSTLLRLLVRLFDVSSGVVTLDGVDVRELKPSALRNAVAVVPQDTVLFNDTVLHNVAYGKPGATPEAVRAAAASAKLDAAIARMPQGWATMVGERGLKLSGGEKQRVAIARAFLREPRLLICDEATSALDTGTERGIMASLQELATGRTSVFVAHRLSTVQGCDRIFVLKEGKVAEEGTHAQLMARPDGIYKEMWEMQAAQDALKEQMHEEEPSPSDEEMTWRAEARDEEEDQDDVWRETEDSSGEESATEGPLEVEAAAVERTL